MKAIDSVNFWSLQSLQSLQRDLSIQQHAWPKQWAAQQLEDFLVEGLPSRRHELWKYTPIDILAKQQFVLPAESAATNLTLANKRIPGTVRLVFINGHFNASLSDTNQLPQEVIALDLTKAWQQYPERCQELLSSVSKLSSSVFAKLNSAFIDAGLYLAIPANVRLEQAIHLLHINTKHTHDTMQHPRHLIDLGENSQAHILVEYVGDESATYLHNVVTQIALAANAELFHYKLQQESPNAFHMAFTTVQQQRDSRAHFAYLASGGKVSRDDMHIELLQSGAFCQLNGLYLPRGKQHIANYSHIDHAAPHTQSAQHYRGIIAEQANAVFDGKIKVHPQAVQVSAQQQNHNLLLGPHAVINTKPQLEIYVDEVSCSHGATVGQLDAEALFYLCSRGIEPSRAQHMLTQGFAEQVLAMLPDNAITEYLHQYVTAKLIG